MGIMAEQAQHHQIRIEAIQAMPGVGIVPRLGLGQADVLHDLVLALPGRLVPREHDFDAGPVGVLGYLLIYEVFELGGEAGHKRRACG